MKKIKFSVIIPTYNRVTYLLKSIDSALKQSYECYEIIVLDDGSSDNTKEEVLKLNNSKIKYIYQENKGLVAARKEAIYHAQGDWIALLDSDDIWLPKHLENIVNALTLYPQCKFTISNFEDFREGKPTNYIQFNSAPKDYWSNITESASNNIALLKQDCYEDFLEFQPGFASAMCFSKSAFCKIGGMNLKVGRRQAEDSHFARRLSAHYRVACIHDITVNIRKHQDNMSAHKLNNIIHKTEILEMLILDGDIPEKYQHITRQYINKWKLKIFEKCFEYKSMNLCISYYYTLTLWHKLNPKTFLKYLSAYSSTSLSLMLNKNRTDNE